jgi:4-hydroxy-tetrahydrodipicolinate synthase
MAIFFRGAAPALITPFTRSGDIDFAAYKKHVEYQIAGGVGAVVVLGTTGEAVTLTETERRKLIDVTVEVVGKRVPVIAGTGSNATSESIERSKGAKEAGADAILSVTPYYNKPTDEGCYRHFAEIAAAVDLPSVLYNVPGRTGKNMNAELLLRLAEIPHVAGVKEASGNLAQVMEVLRNRPPGYGVWSGEDDMTFAMMALGADGVISVIANEMPKETAELVRLCLEGDFTGARELQFKLLPLMNGNFIESNPIPVKTALALMGRIEESFRLPLVPMQPANRETFRKILQSLSLID